MKKTMFQIYAFAICFFTVTCFVVTFALFVWDFVELSAPQFTLANFEYQCHQSDSAYQDCFADQEKYTRDENPLTFPSGVALTTQRINHYAQALQAERRQAIQGIAQKMIVLLINLGVFLIHWRFAKPTVQNGG